MTDLNRALLDIRNIRRQMAETTEFRGYGPLTLSLSAVLALIAGLIQARWLPNPAVSPGHYIALWLATGIVCASISLLQMLTRATRLHSGMADAMIRAAIAQFLPAAISGFVLPFVLWRAAPESVWMLPGLWQLLFSLGVFASCRSLPRPMRLVGVWFLLTGFASLLLGGSRALVPLSMAGPYAIGMLMAAAIHHLYSQSSEADDVEEA